MEYNEIITEIEKLDDDDQLEIYLALQNDFEEVRTDEQIGVEYAYEEFKDITSIEAFREKLKEVNNLRLNYMQPIGLPQHQSQTHLFNANR